MPMKLSLALGPRKPLSRQVAWGCFTTNLAFPGCGSLLAGRKVGYAQIPFTIVGLGLSLVTTIQAFIWLGANWASFHQLQDSDPVQSLLTLWGHIRLPLVGLAIFLIGLCWALLTSLGILNEARRAECEAFLNRPLPPKLKGN